MTMLGWRLIVAARRHIFMTLLLQWRRHDRKLTKIKPLFILVSVGFLLSTIAAVSTLFPFKSGNNLGQQQRHHPRNIPTFDDNDYVTDTGNIVYWSALRQQQLFDGNDDDRIFFHETSGRLELSFRQNCAVESAALHNPQRRVQIYFQPQQQQGSTASVIDESSAWFRVLSHYDNIQMIVIDDEELYFKDSPLEDWYRKGEWRNSRFRIQHMADYIRMVTLKKGTEGGMYLDLDVLTLKPYGGPQFRDFLTVKMENFNRITNAVFHLAAGHPIIEAVIEAQAKEYDPDDYMYNGPGAMTQAVADLCHLKSGNFNISCTDLHLLLPHYFHPEGTTSENNNNILVHDIFQRTDEPGVAKFLHQIRATSYGVHFHNFYSKSSTIDTATANSTQVFAILASENCPLTFAAGQQVPNQFFAV